MTVSIGSRLLYRSFFRAVPLPGGVWPAGVKATFKNRVAEVTALRLAAGAVER